MSKRLRSVGEAPPVTTTKKKKPKMSADQIRHMFRIQDLMDLEPVKRPSCTGPRPTPSSPLSLRTLKDASGLATSTRKLSPNWSAGGQADKAYSRGPRTDNFGNPHPSDQAISQLGYVVMHHVDGVHNSRTRKTDRPYANPGRQRPAYQPLADTYLRLDSPEAVIRREMHGALQRGEVASDRLPPWLQRYVDLMDRLVSEQHKSVQCKTWVSPNRWKTKRLKIQEQWRMEVGRR